MSSRRQRSLDELRQVRNRLQAQYSIEEKRRHLEEEVRDELRDAHAKTILTTDAMRGAPPAKRDIVIEQRNPKAGRRLRKARTR